MKSILVGAGLLAAALIGGAGAANAQIDVQVGPGYHRDWHHRYWRDYDYDRRCRTIITHRINGRGDRVTVRKRICD